MDKKIRRLIAYALFAIVGIIEAIEWITVLREHLPESLLSRVNQPTAIVFFIVGGLFLFLGRSESEQQFPTSIPAAPAVPISLTNQVSPNITVINNPPAPVILPQATSVSNSRTEISHNVQYMRVKDFARDDQHAEVFTACFENVPIPNRSVKIFNNVKVKADYKLPDAKEPYLSLFPSGWAQDESDEVYMRVGMPHYAVIAMKARDGWSAVEVMVQHNYWGDTYDLREYILPVGESLVTITLIGDRGISLEAERFHLNIKGDGTAEARHIPQSNSA